MSKDILSPVSEAKHKKTGPRDYGYRIDLDRRQIKEIIRMVRDHRTLQEIGDKFGKTREWARQVISTIKAKHGNKVLELNNELVSVTEAAKSMGVSYSTVLMLCHQGKIKYEKRGRGLVFVRRSAIKKFKKKLASERRRCVVCDKTFIPRRNRIICSKKCRLERQIKNRYKEAGEVSVQGWHKILIQKLDGYSIPGDDQWLTGREIKYRTGLTKMRVAMLRLRKMVAVRPHPTKRWRGKPINTYSASQMDIVAEVFKKYSKRDSGSQR